MRIGHVQQQTSFIAFRRPSTRRTSSTAITTTLHTWNVNLLRVPISLVQALLLLLLLSSSIVRITSFPNGAPACSVGKASPNGAHLQAERNPRNRHLDEGLFYIQVGGTILNDTNVTYDVNANEDILIILTSTDEAQIFRGILLVASSIGSNLTGELFLEGDEQSSLLRQMNATSCEAGRAGVTHIDNEIKTSVEATLNLKANYNPLLLDVNIVAVNNARNSIFYYDQYKLRVSGAPPTRAPTIRPNCGLFRQGFLCRPKIAFPKIIFCGFFGRLIGQNQKPCLPQ
jgi:hypothetical protein